MPHQKSLRRTQADRSSLLSEDEAAEYLSLSARTLQNYRVRGSGPTYIKLGSRAVRYRLRDLDEVIETRVRNNTSQHMIESGFAHSGRPIA